MSDEHLHSLGDLGDPPVGDVQVELVQVSDLSAMDSLLDVPVGKQNDGSGRVLS